MSIKLPEDLEWYDELGGEAAGFVCPADVGEQGWWHIEELDLPQRDEWRARFGAKGLQ